MTYCLKIALLSLIWLPFVTLALVAPVPAQDLGIPSAIIGGENDVNIDRFGKPVFGFRAQREPELRRLRAQAGREVLRGQAELYDIDSDDLERAFSRNKNAPKISCTKEQGEVVCKAE